MAATTRLLQLRLKPGAVPYPTTSLAITHHHFSSTTNPQDPDQPPPENNQRPTQPSFSSYFNDVKASLKTSSQPSRPYPTGRLTPQTTITTPVTGTSLEELSKNLSNFRRLSAPPPPSSSPSTQSVTLEELYKRNVISKGSGHPDGDNDASSPFTDVVNQGLPSTSPFSEKMGFSSVFEKIKMNRNINSNQDLYSNRGDNRIGWDTNASEPSPMVIGGGGKRLPLEIFGKELNKEKGEGDESVDQAMKMRFLKMYSHEELGKELMVLRPERKKGEERVPFSLVELNERLTKLREKEEKRRRSRSDNMLPLEIVRESLAMIDQTDQLKARKNTIHRVDVLANFGESPSYMLSTPKEELVEKYFHPDNMSSSEKLKLELKKVRDEFKLSESDCGSARVQVAQLTTKIKHLSTTLHKKDKHSRKGLQAMVQIRKKLLKYLRRTHWDSYCLVLSKLGLRDNPDYKN